MIYIYTGAPGAGKTMCLIAHAVERGRTEKRPVYVSGIPGLSGEGIFPLDDPKAWTDCPDNSIVIIDEAQRIWGTRLARDAIPESLRALETHRHRGIDLYCATQSINMLDVHLRRLCGVHRHLVRVFGLRASTVYEWDEACDDTRDHHARRQSRRSRFKFSKKYFRQYKSMTMDTAQSRVPWWLKWGAPLLFGLLIFAGYTLHKMLTGARSHFAAHAVASRMVGHVPGLPPGYHRVPSLRAGGGHGWRRHVRRTRWHVVGRLSGQGVVLYALQRGHGSRSAWRTVRGSRCRGGPSLYSVRCRVGGGWARAF